MSNEILVAIISSSAIGVIVSTLCAPIQELIKSRIIMSGKKYKQQQELREKKKQFI